METTLDKLFTIFDDIKRLNIFSICIQQIVEIHNQCPSSIQYILKKTMKLLYSVTQDKILQLEHRHIAAGIIEKTFKGYCNKITDFMYAFEDNQSQYSHLFAFEFSEKNNTDEVPQEIIIQDLKQARKCQLINLNQIDFDYLFQNSEHLLGKNMSDIYTTSEIEQKKNEEEILEQLGVSNSLTEGNLEMVLRSISGDFFKSLIINKQEEEEEKNTKKNKRKREEEPDTKNVKKKVKIENIGEEIIQNNQKFVKVFNPFNIVYQKCLKNILHSNWELRHASALVLRGFIKSDINFLSFEFNTDSKINNLEQFTKEIIKNQLANYYQNNCNLKLKLYDLISRNLLIVALDRFADFLTDKANIIVRETSSQILSHIFSSDQYRSYLNNDDLQQLFNLLEQFFKQKDWEVKQSSLFLLKQIIKIRPDKHEQIFQQFNDYFLQFIDHSQIDEVILISAECLTELIFVYKNNKKYLKQLQNNVTSTISYLDDITYAIKTLISLLNQIIQIQIQLDENIVSNIIKLFYHKISDVRYECYIFYDSILNQINNKSYSYDQLLQLYVHSMQAVIIEENATNFFNAYKMSLKCFQLLNKQDRIQQLNKLIIYSLSQKFPSEIIQNFDYIGIQYEINENPYTFYIVLENQQQLKEFYYLRMFKLSKYIAEISSQFNYIEDIQQILKQQLNQSDHRHILNILSILINLEILIKSKESYNIVDYLIDGSVLESLLQLEFYDINSEELSLIDKQILTLLSKNQSIEIQNFAKINDYKERRKKYEIISKNSSEDQSLVNIASYIQDFVNTSFEIIIMIRSQAACLYIQINQRKFQKAPDRLNLVIKPLIQQISQEYFYFQSLSCSQSLFLLAKNMKFSTPCQKMIKNLIVSVLDKSNKSQKKNINFNNDKFKFIIFTEKFSKKYEGINIFFSLVVNEFKQKSFQKINFIQQTFEELQQKINYTQNLRIIKILIPSLHNLYYENDLINILSKQMIQQNTLPDQIMQQKIFQRLLIEFLLKDFKQHLNMILENFYTLFKNKIESVYIILENILDKYLIQFIPYGPIFVLQIVKSLTNSNQIIQQKSFLILGNLITALFLQIDHSANNNLTPKLQKKQKKGVQFILDFKNPANFVYKIQDNPSITLREYQKEGIKWLGFLIKYNLNGALCDEMGLGKTIQTLTVIQNEIIIQKTKLPTIILCPPILQEHWNFEIQKFMDSKIMSVHIIQNYINVEKIMKTNDIIIVSYHQILKIKEILKIKFRFCILDEGHLIKNPKSQVSITVKQIQAEHKFILTGTPIQNNLKELWALFDFLMPNYLGNKELFKKNFSKLFNTNIMQFSNDNLVFTDEQNTALQDLHKRVMPFIMRRRKQDVLQELPQKIIQDYYCHMSNVQSKLYKEIEDNDIKQCQNQIQKFIQQEKNEINEDIICPNILSAIQNMIKLVNHPMMLVDQNKQNNYQSYLKSMHSEINQYDASGKFNSFRQLLIDLGFEPQYIQEKETQEKQQQFLENNLQNQNNQSKILVFSRFKQTLKLLISLLIEKEFSYISYLQLDGDVPINQRFAMVRKFNEIPIYKILFLTTQIGGLGLNLTSANIVVMFDHNFNPQSDLQAMDRAHRIGQKNVVNVYRLITKDTLEEKIMGIQNFKLNIANTIINIDNASIKNIEESNIVGLIDNMIGQEQLQKLKETDEQDELETKINPYKKLLSGMQKELWEEQEYNKEY